jgi:hypothetical protein
LGSKVGIIADPSINVTVLSNNSVVRPSAQFFYGLKWSDSYTWGGEIAPRAGDSVFVPAG